ncbi:MAG: endo-1,4-beta-xylanase [Clostridiales bacterium]|nr:endo-1,4-beta-xylanase [Clostridiales bacterium]
MKVKTMTVLAALTASAMMLTGCPATPGETIPTQSAPADTEATGDTGTPETEAPETDPVEVSNPLEIVENFDGTTDYWRVNGDCTVTIENGDAIITDRASANAGIEIPCDAFRGNTIHTAAVIKSTNDMVRLSLRYNIYGNVSYVNIAGVTPMGSIAQSVAGDITIPDNATDIVVYLEATDVKDITVQSMSISVVGDYNDLTNTPVATLQDASGYESLAELYADYFKMGSAVPATVMTNPNEEFRTLLVTEFNSVTPENELKPENVLDAETTLADPETYNECPAIHFDAARPILDFCQENGIPMRGHTLVWYSQTPSWFFYENYDVNGELADRELMLTRMENYIDSVMNWCEENYPGVIYAWDVVNEAAGDNGGMRDCYWKRIIGDDYVEKAFEFARAHGPEGVQLFYNDYNEYQAGKQQVILDMLAPIAAAGNIDGMGMQSHIGTGLMPDTYIEAINRYVDELGVIIHITELDVSAPASVNAMYDQGTYMQRLFEAIIDAVDAGTPIECVTFWGLTDEMSWKSSDRPLLFYGDITPKPAFEGVVCAMTGGEITIPDDYIEVEDDFTPIIEDYEDEEFIGGPRYSAVQTIVGDAFEGDFCLENSDGSANYDGYSIDITRFVGQTIHFSFAVKTDAEMVCFTGDIDGTWPHLIEVDTSSGEWVEAEGEWEVPAGMTALSVYFESSDMSPFYLDNLVIEVVQ